MKRNEINSKLKIKIFADINKLLFDTNQNIEMVVVGGVGFLLHDMIDRSTTDIDFINKIDENIIDHISGTLDIDINGRVSNHAFKRIFLGWEENTVLIHEFSNLKVLSLNKEFLCSTKFFTRESDSDLTDFAYKNVASFSRDKLEGFVTGVWNRTTSVEQGMMIARTLEIIEFYKGMGWKYEESIIEKLLS